MREGVRGGRSGERGKHGEVFGYAGRRDKGESGVRFASGVWRFPKKGFGIFAEQDENTTVFVDNLPDNITKRELYKEFGRDGYVLMFSSQESRGQWQQPKKRMKKMWVEVRRPNAKDTEKGLNGSERDGVSVKPIEFRKTMNFLLDEWKGEREIECRDMGPYRFLITFSSIEIKQSAMNNEVLLSAFDEVRPHWDLTGALSRRVSWKSWEYQWACGLQKIWKRLQSCGGKLILIDDRTEAMKSFSVARVLMDSFQWEIIHEWISLKVDDRVFDVFAKEFGYESYNTEAHLNLGENCPESSYDGSDTPRSTMVTRPAISTAGGGENNANSRNDNVGYPLIEAIINAKLENVQGVNGGDVIAGEEEGMFVANNLVVSMEGSQRIMRSGRGVLRVPDPMVWEAQIAGYENAITWAMFVGHEKDALLPNEVNNQLMGREPFVTGCGPHPCAHTDPSRVPNCPQIENQHSNCTALVTGNANAITVCWDVENSTPADNHNVFPLSRIDPAGLKEVVGNDAAALVGNNATASTSYGSLLNEGRVAACESATGETGQSGETLYRINYEALQWERSSANNTVVCATVEEQVGGEVNQRNCDNESEEEGYSDETLYLINENNVGKFINGELLKDNPLLLGDGRTESLDDGVSATPNIKDLADLCEEGDDVDEIEQFDEVNFLTEDEEAVESKKVWSKSGLSFYNSDDDEVLNRVADKKLVYKKRGELRQKRLWDGMRWDYVGPVNASGGILCVWNEDFFTCNSIQKSDRWIVAKGRIVEKDFECAICVIYGPLLREQLSEVYGEVGVPILIGGDFNEISDASERK
ncbi:hypothetical protein PIB30_057554 [Stylosanthes scabra]|uniref:RRM domain-containing protein n=1 Tax=Stylosanthes scabra TaxID=79078 RepID=A0ABU6XJZ0_9FABA|nr:hypothetical protein [Stylosanthes scabra]